MLDFELSKRFDGFTLQVAAQIGAEWLVMLAPSGAGKSLTLDMIAGLVRPEAGHVRLEERTLFDRAAGVNVPIRRRRLGYAFQRYALFPHMTVAANVGYGLPAGEDGSGRVRRWLEFFHLAARHAAYPDELSGGQQQRVALARALASEPRALLLDEPLSALDPPIREGLQRELAALKSELSIPVVLVTHDFKEAQVLGDKVMVLLDGRIVEAGERDAIFARPRRSATARFLGVENVLPARVQGSKGKGAVVDAGGVMLTVEEGTPLPAGTALHACIHAADVRLAVTRKTRPNLFAARVARITPAAGTNRVEVAGDGLAEVELTMLLDNYVLGRYDLDVGSPVRLWLPPGKIFLCE